MNPNQTIEDNDNYVKCYCPITLELFKFPVIVPCCGVSLERDAIEKHLEKKKNCPLCRESLNINMLISNRSLIENVERIKETKNLSNKIEKHIYNLSDNNLNIEECKRDFKTDNLIPLIIEHSMKEEDDNIYIVSEISYSKIYETEEITKDISILLDISGSTSSLVQAKGNDGQQIEGNLSILDLEKHCTKTIINLSKNKNIRISIYTFSTDTNIILEPMFITDSNLQQVIDKIDLISYQGTTYMFEAIKYVYDNISRNYSKQNNYSIMLFTDGQPSSEPPLGIEKFLDKLQKDTNLTIPIHTFGFSKSIKERILPPISKITNGINSFIMDGSTLGTFMIYVFSYAINVCCSNLKVILKNGDEIIFQKNIGSLQYDIDRTNLINLPKSLINNDTIIEYSCLMFGEEFIIRTSLSEIKILEKSVFNKKNSFIICEKDIIDGINFANTLKARKREINFDSIYDILDNEIKNGKKYAEKMTKTFEEQISVAFEDNYYSTWGKHYIPAIQSAIENQVMSNFKDDILEIYGKSENFEKFTNEGENIFSLIPAPVPKITYNYGSYSGRSNYNTSSLQQQTINMSSYIDRSAPCFHENCLISICREGVYMEIPLYSLKEDDKLFSDNSTLSNIKFIVKTECLNGIHEFVKLDNLLITPYHPIYKNNEWIFPIDINPNIIKIECSYIYSIALENGNKVYINKIPCITLGHNIKNDKIAEHPYFGTNKIIEDLEERSFKNSKIITLPVLPMLKNLETNLISSIIPNIVCEKV